MYLFIEGIILSSVVMAGSAATLLALALIGILLSVEYRNNPTPPSSPVIIVVEQENPINIVQKQPIEKVDITGLDPSVVS